MRKEKVLVTGGAGFIGSHLVERLLKEGFFVRVLDNFSTGDQNNLTKTEHLELIEGDLRSENDLDRAVDGVSFILHQAALGSVPRSIDDPLTTHECNATGTLKLLLAAKQAKVKRLVYASSSSVYGDTPVLPKIETMNTNPRSPYALSKLAGEIYCKLFNSLYGLETVCLRYFNVFGPRQSAESQYAAVIPCFLKALLESRPVTIYGDGEQTRDFTYVENVVEANLLAMTAPHIPGEIFNIACGERYSVKRLAQELSRAVNLPLSVEYRQARPGDVRDSFADIKKAEQAFGYQPKITFQKAIEETAKWSLTKAKIESQN
ncbi:MAG: SDR family oxidoreductase [Blastocatellia bacterium]|nr:SDR family oxidoreductase [Blastocatellia bacterium]